MKGLKAGILLVLALSAVPLFGKVQAYLKIDGVQGSSKDPAHSGWIELQSWDWELPNALASHKCTTSHAASFIANSGPPGSGEEKLAQMCRAHMPIAQLTVELPGGQRHVLQSVQFRTCHNVGEPAAEFEVIGYDHCATHAIAPAALPINVVAPAGAQVIVGAAGSQAQSFALVSLHFLGATGTLVLQSNANGTTTFFHQAFQSKQTTPSVVVKAGGMTWTFTNLLVSGYQQGAGGTATFTLNFTKVDGPPGGYH